MSEDLLLPPLLRLVRGAAETAERAVRPEARAVENFMLEWAAG